MSGARRLTIALAGGAGSGKSTVARELAGRLNGNVSSFGDFVRHLATELGEPIDRTTLQRIGQARVDADPNEFVRTFLAWASVDNDRPLIIDGVRHAAVDGALRRWATTNWQVYSLILLDVSVHERAKRRHGGDDSAIMKIDAHPVERETLEILPGLADLIIEGGGSPSEVIARIQAAAQASIAHQSR